MTQKTQTPLSQRVLSLVLTVLLVCQFIYVPSLTAFAADGDVTTVTYYFVPRPYGYQDQFRIQDSLGHFAELPRNYYNSFKSLSRISSRTSRLHLLRHILPKSSAIHKVLPAVLASSGTKSDGAIRTRRDPKQALNITTART